MKYPHLATQYLVFNLQNERHRYNEFLFRTSAATLIKKGEDEAIENEHGGGSGRKRGPVYCHVCRYLSIFLTTVSYVEQ